MPAPMLTLQSSIQCLHGGVVILATANVRLLVDNAPVLTEADAHQVVGCPFTLPGPKPSPCTEVRWSNGSAGVTVGGAAVLTAASVGLCYSAEGAMQGVAIISGAAPRANG